MNRTGLTALMLSLLPAFAPAAESTLPWPDAAPTPAALPADFARMVMPPVVVTLPGMEVAKFTRNLRYTDVDDPNVLLDVYQPGSARSSDRLPVVVFVHGGTDTRAQPKDWGSYQSWGRLVAASGMVGITFTHRLGFPQTRVREGASDVAAAISFLRSNGARFNADPDRICLAVYSAGGPMLAPYMVDAPQAIRCLVAYYPFMDIRQSELHRTSETEQTRDAFSNILQVAKPGRKTPLYLARAGRDEIPTLLDSVDRFTVAALAANYPLTLQNHPEGPHGFDNQTNDARSREIVLATLAFLKQHLFEP